MTDPERNERVEAIFKSVLGHAPDDRAAFLASACAGDESLRSEVESLLAADCAAGGFLDAPSSALASKFPADDPPMSLVGRRIGRYRIERLIATGGMGAVYEATQDRPHRAVALKLIKGGIASPAARRRFENEAEILGRLRHPNIAQVFDAGTFEEPDCRVPYFAMELLDGAENIIEFSRKRGLDIRTRLSLFADVCEAVHHAHQRGVIHRDLKPANILVVEESQKNPAAESSRGAPGAASNRRIAKSRNHQVPKILDFGVARATDASLGTATVQTDAGELIGTIPYMSPEQILADPAELDVRSDVYALGVVLYQLLADRLPYDLRGKSIPEAARTIAEVAPRPLGLLGRPFRGDLETIVQRALEKDKARRYQSTQELGADVHRYLCGDVIEARRASSWYVLRRSLWRHRVTAGVAAGFVLLVIAFAAVAVQQALIIRQERDQARLAKGAAEGEAKRAQREAQKAERFGRFLDESFAWVTPEKALGRDTVLIREMLDDASSRAATLLEDDPEVQAMIRERVGHTYSSIRAYDDAEAHLSAALKTYRSLLGEKYLGTARTLTELGMIARERGDSARAEELYVKAISTYEDLGHGESIHIAPALSNLASLFYERRELAEAEPLFRRAHEIYRHDAAVAVFGEAESQFSGSLNNLAAVYLAKGDRKTAIQLFEESLAFSRERLGDEHPITAAALANLGALLQESGDYSGAEPLLREAVDISRKILPSSDPSLATRLDNLAVLLWYRGRLGEAEPLFQESLAMRRELLGDDHLDLAHGLVNLSSVHYGRADYPAAERTIREALAILLRHVPEVHPEVVNSRMTLGAALRKQNNFSGAEEEYQIALAACRKEPVVLGGLRPHVLGHLAGMRREQNRLDEATALYDEAMPLAQSSLGENHPFVAELLHDSAIVLSSQGATDDAVGRFRQAYQMRQASLGIGHNNTGASLRKLLDLYADTGRFDEADELISGAIAKASEELGESHGVLGAMHLFLGNYLTSAGRYAEAESALFKSRQVFAEHAEFADMARRTMQALTVLYTAWDKPEKATEIRLRLAGLETGD